MANPVIVSCPKNVWTKVATNVASGHVWIAETGVNHYHTYRLTGESAPGGTDELAPMPDTGIPISSSLGIDVYIFAQEATGKVRVDV